MNKIQIHSRDNKNLLRLVCKRLYDGWYTVKYNGVRLDGSTIFSAKYNKGGELEPHETM